MFKTGRTAVAKLAKVSFKLGDSQDYVYDSLYHLNRRVKNVVVYAMIVETLLKLSKFLWM